MAIATRNAELLITTYLEMTSPDHFMPAYIRAGDVEIVKMEMPDLGFYKFLYQSVGEEWAWRDRLQMSNAELRQVLTSADTQVHVLYVSGSPAVTSSCFVTLTTQSKSSTLVSGATIWDAAWASTC